MATPKDWIEAIRPKTLPAGIVPVCIAASYSHSLGEFNGFIFAIILLCSVMIQIITNFFNEIYDFKRGADTIERKGPARGVSTGAISLKSMWIVTIFSIIITFFLGLILVNYAGIEILFIGLVSLFMAWLYTGGPYPLAYLGLGDLFVLIFFGLVATVGTFYVFTQAIDSNIILLSFVPGLLSMNILAVNNIRDIETDIKVNKKTLAVRIGKTPSIVIYIIVNVIVYFLIYLIAYKTTNKNILYGLITSPLSILLIFMLITKKGKSLNKALALNGLQLMLVGLIISLSFIVT